jgi:hypothetical protein
MDMVSVNKLMVRFIEDIGRKAEHMVLEYILRIKILLHTESGKEARRYIGSKDQNLKKLKMEIRISEIISNDLQINNLQNTAKHLKFPKDSMKN